MSNSVSKSLIIFLYLLHYIHAETKVPPDTVHFLEPGDIIENDKAGLHIFCSTAKSKYLANMWKSIIMNIHTNIDTYDIYDGKTAQEVVEKHEDNQRSWRFNFFGSRKNKSLKINPFEDTCIGVYTYPSNQQKYTMNMTQTSVDVSKLLTMMLGVIIYWSAQKLSRNPLFYYICGITLGVTSSIIILIYLVSKLFPRGKFMYLMVATGWTMSFYLAQALWENAQLILIQYREWVMWYILGTSLISFIICYRFGPVTNPRTKKIIQWFLQISGLTAMYFSSYFQEASFACCIIIILLYNFPLALFRKGKSCWKNMFPQRRKLLSEDQYRKEAIRETNKALKELQEYCSSPECNPWKTVLRLKEPIRFAKFVEGDSHVSDDETLEHDAEITKLVEECECTDDEDDL